MRREAVLPIGCAVLAACTQVSTRSYTVARPSPPYEGRVRILMLGAPLPESFEEVAVVQAQGSTEVDRLMPALQREAARLGCNAILHVRIHDGQATGMAVRIPQKRPMSCEWVAPRGGVGRVCLDAPRASAVASSCGASARDIDVVHGAVVRSVPRGILP